MCLATIYGKKQEDETILLKNASRIDTIGSNTLLGFLIISIYPFIGSVDPTYCPYPIK